MVVVELSATGGLVRGAVGIEAEERVVLALRFGDDPVELPATYGKRDGSGTPVEKPPVAVGRPHR